MSEIEAPKSLNRLRACTRCRIILPATQFTAYGCPNCPDLQLQGDRVSVEQMTTKIFSGCVGVVDPKKSWVARHILVDSYVPGMYAIAVQGGEEDEDYDRDDEGADGDDMINDDHEE